MSKKLVWLLLVPCVAFMVLNITTYSPGKTIDPVPTTARQFYNSLDSIPDGAIVVGHTWGHPDLCILMYSVEHQDRFDYVNLDSIRSKSSGKKYIGYQIDKGIVLLSYTDMIEYYGEVPTVAQLISELRLLNPERKIYVTYVKSSKIPMEFGLMPASKYEAGRNDVPVDKIQYVR